MMCAQESCCLRKGTDAEAALKGIHAKVEELNNYILPPGVKVVPFLDRSDLLHFTTHTVLHNLTEGIVLVVVILFLFLGNARGAVIVALTIPFSLLFAATCLKSERHSGELAVAGRAGFRDGGGWRGGDGGEHRAAFEPRRRRHQQTPMERIRDAAHEVQRPVFYAIAIIVTAYLPIFTLQRVEGRLFKPMAWTVAFALLGALLFSMLIAPVLASIFFRKGAEEWHNPVMEFVTRCYREAVKWAIEHRVVTRGSRRVRGDSCSVSCVRRRDRFGISAAPGRRAPCGCGARWRPAPDRPKARGWRIKREFCFVRFPK